MKNSPKNLSRILKASGLSDKSASSNAQIVQAAVEYTKRGFAVVRVRPMGKEGVPGWDKVKITAENAARHFKSDDNIGVRLGAASTGTTDIDLDCKEAVNLAPEFLPHTYMVFGRRSNPRSHYIYRTDLYKTEDRACIQYRDPDRAVICEIRIGAGAAALTRFPPSTDASGEIVRFYEDGDPAIVDGLFLKQAAAKLAAAALLVQSWPAQGGRQAAALAIDGFLARAGWEKDERSAFIEAVAKAAGDEEAHTRKRVSDKTDTKLATGKRITGFPTLIEIFGEAVAKCISKILELDGASAKAKGGASRESESISARLIGLAYSRDIELFSDQNGKPFLSIVDQAGGMRTFALTSGEAAIWLRSEFFAEHRAAVPSQALSDALATLQAQALFAGPRHAVSVRVARQDDTIYIDLGRADGATVAIDKTGWRVISCSPVKFRRPSGFGELPIPETGGSVSLIPQILNLEKDCWPSLLGFILGCLRAQGPYFCLLVDGEQGSGKSSLCAVLKRILDPGRIENLPPPSSDEQLMIQAKDCHLLVIDNASGLRNDISDALCRLATGAALAKRKLYSDDDVHILTGCIPFIINGIGEFVHRPDLLERSITISLRSMPEDSRKGVEQIFSELEKELPLILGALYTAVSTALRRERAVSRPTNVRMADAAAWLKAAEPNVGLPEGTLLASIVEGQERAAIDRIRENSLVLALEIVIANGPYAGRVGDLFNDLRSVIDRPDRTFPPTAAHLSNQLQRLRPAMAKIGIFVELERRDRAGRSLSVWKEGQDKARPVPIPDWMKR